MVTRKSTKVVCGSCEEGKEVIESAMQEITPSDGQASVTAYKGKVGRIEQRRGCGCSKTHEYSDCNCKHNGGDCGCRDNLECNCSRELPMPMARKPKECVVYKDVFARVEKRPVYPALNSVTEWIINNVNLTEGQRISHEKYGTFYVHEVLCAAEGRYLIENRGGFFNDPSLFGKEIPSGVEFFLGELGSSDSSPILGCVDVLSDVIVPSLGKTVSVPVSSLSGFDEGREVVIRNRTNPSEAYKLTLVNVIGTDTLELRNDGDATAGAKLFRDSDCDGTTGYCIEQIGEDDIYNQAVETECIKYLFGFDKNGNKVKIPIDGDREVLVGNSGCEGGRIEILPESIYCVMLESCFQVVPLSQQVDPDDVNAVAPCCQPISYIETSDDAGLLAAAEAVLISENADPIIYICETKFRIILRNSDIGSIAVQPLDDISETIKFDEKCRVCIPADCCTQCDTDIEFPLENYQPNGKSGAAFVKMNTDMFQAEGEYYASIISNPNVDPLTDPQARILVFHDPATGVVTSAYDYTGGALNVATDIPADIREWPLEKARWCNDTCCPVYANVIENVVFDMVGMPDILTQLTWTTKIWNKACDEEVSPSADDLTFNSIVRVNIPLKTPTKTMLSPIAVGINSPWGQVGPTLRTFSGATDFQSKSTIVPLCRCVEFQSIPRLAFCVEAGKVPTAGQEIQLQLGYLTEFAVKRF